MSNNSTIIGQLLQMFSRYEFQKVVFETGSEYHAKGFTSWNHFVSMLFAQLAGHDSLRGVEAGLATQGKKLYHLGIKPVDLVKVEEVETPFAEWYAHVFLINRKKHVIFVERQTLFSFSCEDVKRKDLRERLPEMFEKGLGQALFVEGANGEVVKTVMEACRGEIRYAKTRDRHVIGAMNEFIKQHKFSYAYRDSSSQDRDLFNRRTITKGFPGGSKEYKMPLKVFAQAVQKQFGLDFKPAREKGDADGLVLLEDCVLDEKSVQAMTYVFDVRMTVMEGDALHGTEREVIREIAVVCDESLMHLAEVILGAFDFECDHCFGFYGNLKSRCPSDSDEVYELFVDCPDVEPTCAHAQSVEKTRVVEVFNDFGKQMRFLFDYGDEWEFVVTFIANHPPKSGQKLPCVLKAIGEAPQQYPDYEDLL